MTEVQQTAPVLQVRDVSKAYPGVQALDRVQLEVFPGTVHALMGENGAGKSTLMKILAGLEQPDDGEIRFQGRPVRLRNPHAALALGIAMIHQELMPFPDLTVAENILMGQEPVRAFPGWIDRARLQRDAAALLGRLGMSIPVTRCLRELTVAEMQTVEIAKAIAQRARVIIMDEPTSAISEREVAALFRIIAELTARGVAVIYISHKLDEVLRLADVVTVLRDGRYIATRPADALTANELIALMVGRELTDGYARKSSGAGEVVLSVQGLGRAGRFRDISFELRRGEILGLAGLLGAGRTDVAHALSGLAPADRGDIRIRQQPVRIGCPADALARGIALVSEDRKAFGLVLPLSVKANLTLSNLRACCAGPIIRHRTENRLADDQIGRFAIKAADRNQAVNSLSGGNQQKVVFARALLTDPEILILDEPTRGIDIGAKAEIYALMARLASEGKAVLLISSELPELLSLSDRVLVMRAGRIAAEVDPRQTTPEAILRHAMPD